MFGNGFQLPLAPSASQRSSEVVVGFKSSLLPFFSEWHLHSESPEASPNHHDLRLSVLSFPSSPWSPKMLPGSYTPKYLVSMAVVQPIVRFQHCLKPLPLNNRIKERPPVSPCPWKPPQSPVVMLYTLQSSSGRDWCQSPKTRQASEVSPCPGFEFQASSKLSRQQIKPDNLGLHPA